MSNQTLSKENIISKEETIEDNSKSLNESISSINTKNLLKNLLKKSLENSLLKLESKMKDCFSDIKIISKNFKEDIKLLNKLSKSVEESLKQREKQSKYRNYNKKKEIVLKSKLKPKNQFHILVNTLSSNNMSSKKIRNKEFNDEYIKSYTQNNFYNIGKDKKPIKKINKSVNKTLILNNNNKNTDENLNIFSEIENNNRMSSYKNKLKLFISGSNSLANKQLTSSCEDNNSYLNHTTTNLNIKNKNIENLSFNQNRNTNLIKGDNLTNEKIGTVSSSKYLGLGTNLFNIEEKIEKTHYRKNKFKEKENQLHYIKIKDKKKINVSEKKDSKLAVVNIIKLVDDVNQNIKKILTGSQTAINRRNHSNNNVFNNISIERIKRNIELENSKEEKKHNISNNNNRNNYSIDDDKKSFNNNKSKELQKNFLNLISMKDKPKFNDFTNKKIKNNFNTTKNKKSVKPKIIFTGKNVLTEVITKVNNKEVAEKNQNVQSIVAPKIIIKLNYLEILTQNKNKNLNLVIEYLNMEDILNFFSSNKALLVERFSYLINKKKSIELILNLKEIESISYKKNGFHKKIKENKKEIQISNEAIKRLKQLNNEQNLNYFKSNNTNISKEIIMIFKILLIFLGKNDLIEIKSDEIFWKKCCNYLLSNSNLGNFILSKIQSFKYEYKNIIHIEEIILGNKDNFISGNYCKLNKMTSFIVPLLTEVIEYCGIIINLKKTSVSKSLDNTKNIQISIDKLNEILKNNK